MDRPTVTNPELLADALDGLTRSPKRMSPKWFYDAAGSALFERITELDDYYPTRTEIGILEARAAEIAALVPGGGALLELGSGSSAKTRLLLDRLPDSVAYVPIDLSREFLLDSAEQLRRDYPARLILPVVGDFGEPVVFPEAIADRRKLAFFPGSTLGNLDLNEATRLLAAVRDWRGIVGFVLGLDLVKDRDTLLRAYDDAGGITAEFNLNLLRRMNREIGATFDLHRFRHRVLWNDRFERIEMHIESLAEQSVAIGGQNVPFAAGETIHTENSHKYTPQGISQLARDAGWAVQSLFRDRHDAFAVAVLIPEGARGSAR